MHPRQVIDSHSGVEVERKFIVKELPPELDRFPSRAHLAGLSAIGEGGFEVRLRRRGESATLTVKRGLAAHATRRRPSSGPSSSSVCGH